MTRAIRVQRAPTAGLTGLATLAALAIFGACAPDGGYQPMPSGDPATFRSEVQPLLEERCANPSCHGSTDRPLEIYATLRHRLDPDDIFVDEPITDQEVLLNQQRAACFIGDLDHGTSSLARKPLPADEGGVGHQGGIIFERGDDPAYLPLAAWVDATAASAASLQGGTP